VLELIAGEEGLVVWRAGGRWGELWCRVVQQQETASLLSVRALSAWPLPEPAAELRVILKVLNT